MTISAFYTMVILIGTFSLGLLFAAALEADQFNGERSYPHLFPKSQPGVRSAIFGFIVMGLMVALLIGHALK